MLRPPKRRRFDIPGHARYFTFSCFRRLPLLQDDRIRTMLCEAIDLARERHRFRLWAWVFMPEHVHLLLWPPPGSRAKEILQSIKQPVARRALRLLRDRNAPVLARLRSGDGRSRFWLPGGGHDRNVFSPREILKKIDYTHENPVRRGLVECALDWRWSSAAWYAGVLPVDLTIDALPDLSV